MNQVLTFPTGRAYASTVAAPQRRGFSSPEHLADSRPPAVFLRPSHGVQFWAAVREVFGPAGSKCRSANPHGLPSSFSSEEGRALTATWSLAMTIPATGASAPAVFNFQSLDVRVFSGDSGEPWFCASDVCAVLGYANSRQAIQKNCREGGVSIRDTPTTSGVQPMTYLNEGNLYRLIVKSRKPEAQAFEQQVMEEILPAIRKTGRYEAPQLPAPALPAQGQITPNLRRRINQKAHALALEQYDTIHDLVEDLVTSNLKCNASEPECEHYIDRFGSSMGGVTLVNSYDLYQLARATTSLLDQAGEALAIIHRLEKHTGMELYHRKGATGLPDSLCKTVFEAIRKYEREAKRSAA